MSEGDSALQSHAADTKIKITVAINNVKVDALVIISNCLISKQMFLATE